MVQNDSLNEFINKVFNYYNGKINKNINAVLKIDWMAYPSSIKRYEVGNRIYPNWVIVYVGNIEKCCTTYGDMLREIIDTIIHELFHVDQCINSLKMSDANYVNHIENAVQAMTTKFIIDNIDDIYNKFGVRMLVSEKDIYEIQNISLYNRIIKERNAYYIKGTNKDMIINIIIYLYRSSVLYNALHEAMDGILYGIIDGNIELVLNGNSMIIQTPQWMVSANQVAEFVSNIIDYNQVRLPHNASIDISTNRDTNTLVIDIKHTVINPMARICYK